MKKIVIAGIVGGLIVFFWGAVSHMVLPLGDMMLMPMANEEALRDAVRNSAPKPGVYFYPGVDMKQEMSAEQDKAWTQSWARGPVGLLIVDYPKPGEDPMGPSTLVTEVVGDILAALLVAFVLAQLPGTFGRRVLCAVLIALVGWLSISVPYWNWYRMSSLFTLNEGIDQVVGWLLAGLAIARITRPG